MDDVKMAAWAARREESERERNWQGELNAMAETAHRKAVMALRVRITELTAESESIVNAARARIAREESEREAARIDGLMAWESQRIELRRAQKRQKAALVREHIAPVQKAAPESLKAAELLAIKRAWDADVKYIRECAAMVRKTVPDAELPARVAQLRAARAAAAERSRAINDGLVKANAGSMAQTSGSRTDVGE